LGEVAGIFRQKSLPSEEAVDDRIVPLEERSEILLSVSPLLQLSDDRLYRSFSPDHDRGYTTGRGWVQTGCPKTCEAMSVSTPNPGESAHTGCRGSPPRKLARSTERNLGHRINLVRRSPVLCVAEAGERLLKEDAMRIRRTIFTAMTLSMIMGTSAALAQNSQSYWGTSY